MTAGNEAIERGAAQAAADRPAVRADGAIYGIRPLRLVGTTISFAAFYLGAAIWARLILPLLLIGKRDRVERTRAAHARMQKLFVLFHGFMRVNRLIHFDPRQVAREVEGQLPEGPCVLVANHPTLVDVTALMASFGSLCTIAKASLFRDPLMGGMLKLSWHIDGGDGGIAGNAAIMSEAQVRLESGFKLLVFPEGTRSPARGMRRFSRGPFVIAARAQVPIVPVLISCDPPVLFKSNPWYRNPTPDPVYRVTVLPAIAPPADESETKQMAADLEARFRRQLGPLLLEADGRPGD